VAGEGLAVLLGAEGLEVVEDRVQDGLGSGHGCALKRGTSGRDKQRILRLAKEDKFKEMGFWA
jgi:hypothetical protein